MKVGDTKQAVILSVAAIGALAFLVTRLLPSGHRAVAVRDRSTVAEASSTLSPTGLPTEVLRDAFAHPALTERYRKLSANSGLLPVSPGYPSGTVPAVNDFKGVTENPTGTNDQAAGQTSTHTSKPKPGETAGSRRPIEKEHKPVEIELKAIAAATSRTAIVQLDGKGEEMFSVGDTIEGRFQVLAINQDTLVLAEGRRQVSLTVGQTIKEK